MSNTDYHCDKMPSIGGLALDKLNFAEYFILHDFLASAGSTRTTVTMPHSVIESAKPRL